ncbi:uncharacterized protein B0H18DRAFT_1208998 [Fomitopsis serialis]|uniref:uncharacterized protein n=1 Tax=Fomitopsis serialis TaxID=139415 RepID=UPI002008E030|nr:uncharacterized protein B0H18DRAFT_1208998 [Neoantrodia serialis]KAH9931323.1 hypothetical protein B0H18DRAFT_1208998 [Neoantrodia serialis]
MARPLIRGLPGRRHVDGLLEVALRRVVIGGTLKQVRPPCALVYALPSTRNSWCWHLQNSLRLLHGLNITIAGDNDVDSQWAQLTVKSLLPTLASLAQLPPFAPTGVQFAEVTRRGSAALITSLVSSLLVLSS